MRVVVTGHRGQMGWWVRRRAPPQAQIDGIDLLGKTPLDIRDPQAPRLVEGADAVIHLAALIDVVASVEDPGPTLSTNVEGTRNLVSGLRDGARFVFVSTAAVYGNDAVPPVREDSPLAPLSPYGESKLEGERIVAAAAGAAGATHAVVRPFNIYSSRQDPASPYTGVITKFIDLARRGEPLRIFGDGSQTRDFVHAVDVADLLWACATQPEAAGGTFNAGTGRSITIAELANTILDVTDSSSDLVFEPPREGEVEHSTADISQARTVLGWEPRIDLRRGLEEVISGEPARVLL